MRRWLVERLRLDPDITAKLGEGDPVAGQSKIMAAGAAGLPGMPELLPPFIIIRALPGLPALAVAPKVQTLPYLIWVHDQQGSFEDVIGFVLFKMQTVLAVDSPIRMQGGDVLMECRWEGDSSDMFDDGFGTATRYGQYRITARRA